MTWLSVQCGDRQDDCQCPCLCETVFGQRAGGHVGDSGHQGVSNVRQQVQVRIRVTFPKKDINFVMCCDVWPLTLTPWTTWDNSDLVTWAESDRRLCDSTLASRYDTLLAPWLVGVRLQWVSRMPTTYPWSSGDLLECLFSPQSFLNVGRRHTRDVKLVKLSSIVS